MGFDFSKIAKNIQKAPENLLKACNPDKSAGTVLMVINALGMAFAALSDTFAAATDKNTSPEDKKFLIPAGLATGVAKIGIYFAMTKKIIDKLEDVAVNFVGGTKEKKGVIEEIIGRINPSTLKDNALKFTKNKFERMKPGIAKDDMKKLFQIDDKGIANNIDEAIKLYQGNTKAAASVLGAFAGAVIGCAIFTPILRDITAYFVQKKMEKSNPELKEEPYKPYTHLIRMGNTYNKYEPMNMKNYMSYTSKGSMRI